jgi:hypothetical protein
VAADDEIATAAAGNTAEKLPNQLRQLAVPLRNHLRHADCARRAPKRRGRQLDGPTDARERLAGGSPVGSDGDGDYELEVVTSRSAGQRCRTGFVRDAVGSAGRAHDVTGVFVHEGEPVGRAGKVVGKNYGRCFGRRLWSMRNDETTLIR